MNSNLPTVSIITVVKNIVANNRADMLRQNIASVQQLGTAAEHIIIDGASTDGTIDLLKTLGVKFCSESDNGIYDAMNKGIRKAKGKYIAFLNSDDFYKYPQKALQAIKRLEKSEADFSYAPYLRLKQKKQKIYLKRAKFRYIFCGMSICHQSMFFKKSLFDEIGLYDTSYKLVSDYDFVLKCILHNKRGINTRKAFVVFRDGGQSDCWAFLRRELSLALQKNMLPELPLEKIENIVDKQAISLSLLKKINRFDVWLAGIFSLSCILFQHCISFIRKNKK